MSELRDELIKDNKRTRAKTLDLANCGLSAIPPEVGELLWLETLHFSNFRFHEDSGEWVRSPNEGPSNAPLTGLLALRKLTELQTLSLRAGEEISPLGQLSGLQRLNLRESQIIDLTPLASLSALQSLDLFNTQVSDLTPLASLSALQSLDLSHTEVSDVTPLASLSLLQSLGLRFTRVGDVTPLASLSALQSLDLGYTQVSDVRPLASLSSLQSLDLRYTQVSDLSALLHLIGSGLPLKWSPSYESGEIGIFVEDCPLTIPPAEIVHQGNAAVLSYFAERDKGGVDRLYEAKMLLLGEGGAGKTTLLRRLYRPVEPMPGEHESTKGIAIYRHDFTLKNGRTFRLNVWDFGGQEIYLATHQFFLTHRSLYILLDDTRKDDKSVQDPGFRNWLGLVEVFGGGSPVLIFQNEKSGRSKLIDFDGIRSRYSNVQAKFQGDLANPHAADALRDAIEYQAAHLSHIGEELPATWIKVRADLEILAARRPHITQQEYFDIYTRHLEFDQGRALILSQYLHDLGVLLHF